MSTQELKQSYSSWLNPLKQLFKNVFCTRQNLQSIFLGKTFLYLEGWMIICVHYKDKNHLGLEK